MKACCSGNCQQGRACHARRQNDIIGKVAGYALIAIVAISMFGGIALVQAQDAIDEAHAQLQALGCYSQESACAAVEASK